MRASWRTILPPRCLPWNRSSRKISPRLAKQKNLTIRTTAPFSASAGPEEFEATPAFTKAAFQLSADVPFAGPIVAADGIYVIALADQIAQHDPAVGRKSAPA